MSGVTEAQKQATIQQLLSTPEGKAKISAAMAAPIRQRFESFRRCFRVDPLPTLLLPLPPKKPLNLKRRIKF